MKIGIVLHPFGENKPAGLSRYIFDLTKSLLEIDEKNEYIIFLKDKPEKELELPGKNWSIEVLGGGYFWLDRIRKATQVDVCIFNTPVMPIFYRPKKSIVIALDYAYKYFKSDSLRDRFEKFLLFKMNGFALKRADKVIAISEVTKRDSVRLFNIKEDKISVIYPGFKKICSLEEKEIDTPKNFFLYVGVIKKRKNLSNIVKSFYKFKENKKSDYKLLISGKGRGEYYEKIISFIKEKGLDKDVVFLDFVTDNELSFLYKRAKCLTFPSLLEGFGMPVLEAMDCGTPVITSNQSSLAEVGSDGSAILVDPYNLDNIAEAMTKIADNDSLRKELITKGYNQAKKFSWEKSAKELLNIIFT